MLANHSTVSLVVGKGFVVINNSDGDWTNSWTCGLPDGTYCDVVAGSKDGSQCTGSSYVAPLLLITLFRIAHSFESGSASLGVRALGRLLPVARWLSTPTRSSRLKDSTSVDWMLAITPPLFLFLPYSGSGLVSPDLYD